jgi:flagellar M-ring protein FliF
VNLAAFIDFLRKQGQAAKEFWGHLNTNTRINLGLVTVVVFGLMSWVMLSGGETRYITLADGLTADQIGEATLLLNNNAIPYRVDENRRAVLVLPKDKAPMLLELQRNNLPVGKSQPSGFEDIFKDPDLMSNQWLNDVNFMRAVHGELERQLNEFEFVDSSHVIIREAEQELFVDEQIPSEAVVTLTVNQPVSKQQTKLIVSMVGRAGGANLHPGNITLATTDGQTLHNPSESEFASIANDKLEYQDEVERRIAQKIKSGMSTLGVQGTVMVSADINFDKEELSEDVVGEGIPISEWKQEHEMSSDEKLPEGAPGALQNVPEAAAAPGGIVTTEKTKDTLTNYELGRTTRRTSKDPGDVLKYSIALVVNGDETEEVEGEDGTVTTTYAGLSEKLRDSLTAIAENAVVIEGVETQVSIVDYEFASAGFGGMSGAGGMAGTDTGIWNKPWIAQVGLLLAILVAFVILRSVLKSATVVPSLVEEEEEVREIPEATLEDMRRQEVASEITQLSMDDPEAVAALLRSWMSTEED